MVQTNNGRCVVRRFAGRKFSALQTCLPIPLLAHRWLILGIAHGSHAVIGVVVLSEGLPCILDIGKCLIEIGCNFLWALPAPMAAAGAPLTIQYDLSTTVPSFQSVWHAPPNGRLTSKHAKRILLMCARAKATTKCCSHDCLSAFRKKEMLKKAARWRMQWHKLSRRQRRQVLLDYLRKNMSIKRPWSLWHPWMMMRVPMEFVGKVGTCTRVSAPLVAIPRPTGSTSSSMCKCAVQLGGC